MTFTPLYGIIFYVVSDTTYHFIGYYYLEGDTMNTFKKAFCRVYQFCFHSALPVLPYRKPEVIASVKELPYILKRKELTSVLIVTDKFISTHSSMQELKCALSSQGIAYSEYNEVQPNPTVDNVEAALKVYKSAKAQAIIAFGGGSSIDCAKAVVARVAYPKRSLASLKGNLRIFRRLPLLCAIPTTAGTGSEVTLTAVITDSAKKHKYTMNSFPLIPRVAVLDPEVTRTLPPHLTATTGMDALTHAVEAYIGRSTSAETRAEAEEAVKLIFENIEKAYADGNDTKARANMLKAAFLAGDAFSKSYVGYVHAIAHSLGGQYGIPHGLANSVLLPILLESYGDKVYKKLSKLARFARISYSDDSDETAAKEFITEIYAMNKRMGIPKKLTGIKKEDIPTMAAYADREGNPLYPVPVLYDREKLMTFYEEVADWSENYEN